MAHSVVDKVNGFEIWKLHSPDKSKNFGFITVPIGYDGRDRSKLNEFDNLTAARNHCGAAPAFSIPTKPKSEYPQNQKGYSRK